ncbi:Glutathione import ATP-binding protein GsiA [Vibrio ruber DSM 16370]|uniref:Glutathione import ATP-binding protein GsiA n=1 Tax=Vibrio ruber (strain DSM 16370 / JCM 11486 / BCRC 17186 / CECT 7878 / LMG 23124 / VR1) TaxID=1123498 RepID=A0A1R4LCA7_VIBR1|nr:ABC transporter ATP-binding protein [Vibrio ruber]SJN54210.1 Glutathione import ATP-binding protein GsiA [Vibrio ruber DSM 16370]
MLKCCELSFSIGSQTLLKDVSFELPAGKTLAIVGESGAGKTLLSKLMTGLAPSNGLHKGQIFFEHQDLSKITEKQWRSLRGSVIGRVSQEPLSALNPVKRAEWILTRAITLHQPNHQLSKPQIRQRVDELLLQVGLQPEHRKRFPHQLSGGQRQRLLIAIAIANSPQLLIADEPSTALDEQTQQQILRLLKRLQQELNIAMVLISHDLQLVRDIADQVLVLKQGAVVEQGSTEQIFSSPTQDYTRMLLEHESSGRPEAVVSSSLLRVNDLSVGNIINGIHFELSLGENLGIIGESGAGKSTLAKALLRLIPAGGMIEFDGMDWQRLSHKELRAQRGKMQFVFQDTTSSFNPRLTIYQSLKDAYLAQKRGQTDTVAQKLTQAMQEVGLDESLLERYPHELSGGQRQRVMIARALIVSPKLLILDEPTTALDQVNRRHIMTLLQRLQAERHFSLIVISHDQGLLERLCHQYLVLSQGQQRAWGEYSDLCDARDCSSGDYPEEQHHNRNQTSLQVV